MELKIKSQQDKLLELEEKILVDMERQRNKQHIQMFSASEKIIPTIPAFTLNNKKQRKRKKNHGATSFPSLQNSKSITWSNTTAKNDNKKNKEKKTNDIFPSIYKLHNRALTKGAFDYHSDGNDEAIVTPHSLNDLLNGSARGSSLELEPNESSLELEDDEEYKDDDTEEEVEVGEGEGEGEENENDLEQKEKEDLKWFQELQHRQQMEEEINTESEEEDPYYNGAGDMSLPYEDDQQQSSFSNNVSTSRSRSKIKNKLLSSHTIVDPILIERRMQQKKQQLKKQKKSIIKNLNQYKKEIERLPQNDIEEQFKQRFKQYQNEELRKMKQMRDKYEKQLNLLKQKLNSNSNDHSNDHPNELLMRYKKGGEMNSIQKTKENNNDNEEVMLKQQQQQDEEIEEKEPKKYKEQVQQVQEENKDWNQTMNHYEKQIQLLEIKNIDEDNKFKENIKENDKEEFNKNEVMNEKINAYKYKIEELKQTTLNNEHSTQLNMKYENELFKLKEKQLNIQLQQKQKEKTFKKLIRNYEIQIKQLKQSKKTTNQVPKDELEKLLLNQKQLKEILLQQQEKQFEPLKQLNSETITVKEELLSTQLNHNHKDVKNGDVIQDMNDAVKDTNDTLKNANNIVKDTNDNLKDTKESSIERIKNIAIMNCKKSNKEDEQLIMNDDGDIDIQPPSNYSNSLKLLKGADYYKEDNYDDIENETIHNETNSENVHKKTDSENDEIDSENDDDDDNDDNLEYSPFDGLETMGGDESAPPINAFGNGHGKNNNVIIQPTMPPNSAEDFKIKKNKRFTNATRSIIKASSKKHKFANLSLLAFQKSRESLKAILAHHTSGENLPSMSHIISNDDHPDIIQKQMEQEMKMKYNKEQKDMIKKNEVLKEQQKNELLLKNKIYLLENQLKIKNDLEHNINLRKNINNMNRAMKHWSNQKLKKHFCKWKLFIQNSKKIKLKFLENYFAIWESYVQKEIQRKINEKNQKNVGVGKFSCSLYCSCHLLYNDFSNFNYSY